MSPYSSKIRRFPADSSRRSRKKKPREPDFTAGIQTPRPPVSFLSVLGDGDGTVGEKKGVQDGDVRSGWVPKALIRGL